jgi:hypothetical protein
VRALLIALILCLAAPAWAGDGIAASDRVDLPPTSLPDVDVQRDASGSGGEKKPPPFGFGGWAHFGGGAGAMIGARRVHPVGRVDIGFGGYLFLVYGGLSANVTFSEHMDLAVTGVAYAGLAIPIPLVRPLIGFKFGGGLHQDFDYGPGPAIQLGPQLGVHIGQIAGSRFGIRVMVDAEALVSIEHRIAGFSIIGTVGLML